MTSPEDIQGECRQLVKQLSVRWEHWSKVYYDQMLVFHGSELTVSLQRQWYAIRYTVTVLAHRQ